MMRSLYISFTLSAALCASCGTSLHDAKSFETNRPPAVTFDVVYTGNNPEYAVGSSKLSPGLIYSVVITAKDPEGEELSYDLSAQHGTLGSLTKTADGATSVFVVGKITGTDTVTVSLTVSDRSGGRFSQTINVGTGKKAPAISTTAPSKYQSPAAADNTFEFSFDCDGYYHLYCDNSISAEDQAVLGASVVRYKASSGKIPVTVVGPTSAAAPSGVTVKLASVNAVNRIWLVFEDALGQPSRQGYTVVVEGTNPSVLSTAPASSASKVPLQPTVTVFFSKAMNESTLKNAFTMKAGTADVALSAPVCDSAAHTASFRPAEPLPRNTLCTVTVSRTAADDIGTSGNSMLADYSFTFTTVPEGYLSVPEYSPAPGAYTGAQTVTIASAEGGSIAYTTDGSTPTASGMLYSAPIPVSADMTLSALAFKAGFATSDVGVASYRIKPSAPGFSIEGGTYTGTQTLMLTAPDATASICYTTDGSAPTAASAMVSPGGSIPVSRNMTVRAVCFAAGRSLPSDETSAVYNIRLAPPAFSEPGGTSDSDLTVYLSAAAGATIWYTVDGSDPLNSKTRIAYGAGIPVSGNGTTARIRACAEKDGYTQSEASEASYTIDCGTVASPKIFIDGNDDIFSFPEEKTAVLTCATPGAAISFQRLWEDSGDPNWTTGKAGEPVYVQVDRSMSIMAFASAAGKAVSGTVGPIYTLTVPDPVVDTTSDVLTIQSGAESAVHYTTDDTTPTASSPLYATPFSIGPSAVVWAKAFRDGWTPSAAVKGGRLVGEWLFDGNFTDTSPSHADGTFYGTITPAADHKGAAGMAYQFTNGEYISIQNGNFNISYGTPFSISLWFKADQVDYTSYRYIIGNIGNAGDFNYFLTVYASTLYPTVGQNNHAPSCSSFSVAAGIWYHAVMIYDGVNVTSYLTDGSGNKRKDTVQYSSSGSVTTSATPLVIGGGADISSMGQ